MRVNLTSGCRPLGLQAAGLNLGDPAAQVLLGRVGIVDPVEVVEAHREFVGPDRLERLVQELIKQVLLTSVDRPPFRGHVLS
jgi:hypothetical protein